MVQSYMNLSKVRAVIVDHDKYVLGLVTEMLKGFGLADQACFETGEAAKDYIARHPTDLCLIEAALPDMSGFDLVSWIRSCASKEIRTMPVLMLIGYTQKQTIALARDCGANSVLKKPVSPHILFDRIAWVARNDRHFVEAPNYIGPDRRFKSLGPPEGSGRRRTDLSADLNASNAEMSQDEIDTLISSDKSTTP